MKKYLHRLENNEVIIDIKERHSTPLGTSLRDGEEATIYEETSFKSSSIENVYNLKCYTKRPKDLINLKKLAPYINKEKLKALQQNKTNDSIIQNA